MEFTRLTKKYVAVDMSATLWDGAPYSPSSAEAAITDRSATCNKTTTWKDSVFDDQTDVARVLVAGPDADPAGAVVLGDDGGRLWLRNLDDPEADYFSAAVIRIV